MPSPDLETGAATATVPLSELADGAMVTVELGDAEVLVARIGEDVYAVDNLCSHAEGWLDMGTLHPASCEIQCPMHDGRFDLRTGNPTHEPCEQPITRYRVTVREGDVHVSEPTP